MNILEVKAMQEKQQIVPALVATIKSAEPKTQEAGDKGPYTRQRFVLQDNTGDIKVTAFGRAEDFAAFVGTQIRVGAAQTKNGWGGCQRTEYHGPQITLRDNGLVEIIPDANGSAALPPSAAAANGSQAKDFGPRWHYNDGPVRTHAESVKFMLDAYRAIMDMQGIPSDQVHGITESEASLISTMLIAYFSGKIQG